MKNVRTFFVPVAAILLLVFFAMVALASEKISVLKYELKPVESVDYGRKIKTEWSAKLRNGASEAVSFSVTIIFVDSDNETLKETTCQCELKAHETRTFKNTVLVESSIASKIASTRLSIKETTE